MGGMYLGFGGWSSFHGDQIGRKSQQDGTDGVREDTFRHH